MVLVSLPPAQGYVVFPGNRLEQGFPGEESLAQRLCLY